MALPAQCKQQLLDGIDALGLRVGAAQVDQLLAYLALLAHWNRHYNLTAVRDPQAMITRHLLDSLAVLPYLHGTSMADLGAGAGLPGIPLAIAAPEHSLTLVDSNGKKTRFLRAAVRELGLDHVNVVESRVEQVESCFDCIVSRAWGSLADMLDAGGSLLAETGIWLALKGRYPEAELAAVGDPFQIAAVHELMVPGLDGERHLVVMNRKPEA